MGSSCSTQVYHLWLCREGPVTTGDKAKGSSLLSHSCLWFFICGEQQGRFPIRLRLYQVAQNKLGRDANERVCARQQEKSVWEKIYF